MLKSFPVDVAGHCDTRMVLIAPREIKCLPEQVINQIAAGEVVERPFSVVKELVENSIDAGASHIAVEIDKGGTSRISVMDNGRGMRPDQVLLAMKRHATSKLRDVDDLFTIGTFGFRGEALPSIASVSKIQLSTKTADSDTASVFQFEGGKLIKEDLRGAPNGTHIVVTDLFYNVQARRKFLRTISTEAAYVHRSISQLAISNPHIHFTLSHNGRQVIVAPKQKTLRKRVESLWGKYLGEEYSVAKDSLAGIDVRCFLGAPSQWLSTTKGILLFVNNRAIKDKAILSTLLSATKPLSPGDGYPTCVLFIDIPQDTMDINVHPQKTEIRFSDVGRVLAAVRHTVREALAGFPNKPSEEAIRSHGAMPLNARRQFLRQDLVKRHQISWNKESPAKQSHAFSRTKPTAGSKPVPAGFTFEDGLTTTPRAKESPQEPAKALREIRHLKLLGETSQEHLCIESPESLFFVKRHLAQSIVVHDSLLQKNISGAERFLLPLEISANELQRKLADSEIEHCASFGFDLNLENDSYLVNSKPLGFAERNIPAFLCSIALTKGPVPIEQLAWLLASHFHSHPKHISEKRILESFKSPEFRLKLMERKAMAEIPLDSVEQLCKSSMPFGA